MQTVSVRVINFLAVLGAYDGTVQVFPAPVDSCSVSFR